MRTIKFYLVLIAAIFAYGNLTFAHEQEVLNFSTNIADNIISIVNNKKSSEGAKKQQILSIIKKDFDVTWMSRFALGKSYRELSQNQKEKYTELYTHYLLANYFPILMKYEDESYKVTKINKANNNGYDVDIQVDRKNAQPILIRYHIKKSKDAKYKVVDMVVEGVSTILSQRSEFSHILQNSGIDGLMQTLQHKSSS